MYSFKYVLRRSLRNEKRDIWYSEADAQALYKLIQKYYKDNPDMSNSEIYNNIMELFIRTNAEIVKIPTLKSDTFRYNICKELNRDPSKRREAYDKVHREELAGKPAKVDETTTYSSNKLSSARSLVLQGLVEVRAQQDVFSEEMKKNYRLFFKASKKFQQDYKRTLNSEERRQLEVLRDLFEGDEYTQLSVFFKQAESTLEKDLKEDYIASILFLGERLKEFNLLEKYHDIQGKMYRALGITELEYPLTGKNDNTISIESLFTREVLEKFDIERLSMLSAFWMNRFTKELDALNKSLCIVNELDLWHQVRTAKPKADTGMISVDVDKEKLKYVYRKIHFLQEASIVMLESFDVDSGKHKDEIIDGFTSKKVIRKVDPTSVLKAMDSTMGADYREYFSELLPEESHHFLDEFDCYRVIENAIHNTYRFKDFNMLAILSNLYQNNSSKNWGVILEEGKEIDKQDMILIGIDIEGFNMPVRLHIEKEMVLDFLKANQGTTLIPVYEGDRDFQSKSLGRNISTPALMPLCKKQREGIDKLMTKSAGSPSTKDFIEHIAFLADSTKYPEHLKEEVRVRKKGKSKLIKRRPARRFVDLTQGKLYRESQIGLQEIEDKSGEGLEDR